jgi:hypothetical protein
MTLNSDSVQFRCLRIVAEILTTISLMNGRIFRCEIDILLTTVDVRKTYRADLKFHRRAPVLSHDRNLAHVPGVSAIASGDHRKFSCGPGEDSSASTHSTWLGSGLSSTSSYLSGSWPGSLNGARLSFTSQKYGVKVCQIFRRVTFRPTNVELLAGASSAFREGT